MNHNQLVRAAYLEWRVAKAYSTGSTVEVEPRQPRGPRHPALSNSWPSHKFVREELGFALEHGPSLAWTCRVLATINRNACKFLGREAPAKYDWPRRRQS